MEKIKRAGKRVLAIVLLVIVALLLIYINHKIRLNKEAELLAPLGQMVEVDGANL